MAEQKKFDMQAFALDIIKSAMIFLGAKEFKEAVIAGLQLGTEKTLEVLHRTRAQLFYTVPAQEYRMVSQAIRIVAGIMAVATGWIIFSFRMPWMFYAGWHGMYLFSTAVLYNLHRRYDGVRPASLVLQETDSDRQFNAIRVQGAALAHDAVKLREEVNATNPAPSADRKLRLEARLREVERLDEAYREVVGVLDRTSKDSDEFIRFLLPWAREFVEVVRLTLLIENLDREIAALPATDPSLALRTAERNTLRVQREREIDARNQDARSAAELRLRPTLRSLLAQEARRVRRFIDPNSPQGRPLVLTMALCVYLFVVGSMLVWAGVFIQSHPSTIMTDTLLGYISPVREAGVVRPLFANVGVMPFYAFPLKIFGAVVFWMLFGVTKTLNYVFRFILDITDMVHHGVRGIFEQAVGNALPFVEPEDFQKFHTHITGSKLLALFVEEVLQASAVSGLSTAMSAMFIPTTYGDSLLAYGLTVEQLNYLRAENLVWAPVWYVAGLFTLNTLIWLAFKLVTAKTGHDFLLESSRNLGTALNVALVSIAVSLIVIFPPIAKVFMNIVNGVWNLHVLAGIVFLVFLWIAMSMSSSLMEMIHPRLKTSATVFLSIITLVMVLSGVASFYRFINPPPPAPAATSAQSVAPTAAPLPRVPTITELYNNAREYATRTPSAAPSSPPAQPAATTTARARRSRSRNTSDSSDREYEAALARLNAMQ